MTLIEWVDYEPFIGPTMPDECHDGWYSHTWLISIEEGSVTLAAKEGCALCDQGVATHILAEGLIEMQPIEVRLEHYFENQGDDSYWWWDAVHQKQGFPENTAELAHDRADDAHRAGVVVVIDGKAVPFTEADLPESENTATPGADT
jgi:hypothetical protein